MSESREGAKKMTMEMVMGISKKSVENIPSLSDIFANGMKGKIAIVTGGATGLGYNVVNRLAEAGASVVIASHNPQKGEKAENEFKAKGYDVKYFKTDVRVVDDCYKVVEFVEKEYGKVDILVNSAAVWSMYAFVDMPEEIFDDILDTDLKGEYFMTQAVARSMIKNKVKGKIVLISSGAHMASDVANIAMMTHYNAAKGGVVSLTKGIAKELKQYGINVNCVAPGGMLTMGSIVNGSELGQLYGQELLVDRGKFGKLTPLAMNPDEVALVVYAMCTQMANFMYGETVDVNGGATLSFQQKPWSYTMEEGIPGKKTE